MKKEYRSPEAEKLALEDEDLDRVVGGTGEPEPGADQEQDPEYSRELEPGEMGNGDYTVGRGRGGGCDAAPYHQPMRPFSSGRNSGCY